MAGVCLICDVTVVFSAWLAGLIGARARVTAESLGGVPSTSDLRGRLTLMFLEDLFEAGLVAARRLANKRHRARKMSFCVCACWHIRWKKREDLPVNRLQGTGTAKMLPITEKSHAGAQKRSCSFPIK